MHHSMTVALSFEVCAHSLNGMTLGSRMQLQAYRLHSRPPVSYSIEQAQGTSLHAED